MKPIPPEIKIPYDAAKDKNQTEQQQKQAFHAVSIFYEIKNTHQDEIGALKHKKENISAKKTELSTGFLGRLLVIVHRRDAKDVEVRVISGSLFLSALV